MSSGGVPPELVVLGSTRSPAQTGQTGRRHQSNRSAQRFVGIDRFVDHSRVLVYLSVFGAILCQHTFWRLRWNEINLVAKTDLI